MSNNIERRTFSVELRADQEGRSVEGYAALYDNMSDAAGWYIEKIAPGAFKSALEKKFDTVALYNHDENFVLARYPDTLELKEDDKGLWYRIAEMPKSREDVYEAIKRGDVKGSSFAFTVKSDAWEYRDDDTPIRTITEIDTLYDVSPVTYPFYKDTSVFTNSDAAKRSFDMWAEKQKENEQPNGEDKGELKAEDVRSFYDKLDTIRERMKDFF